MLTCGEGCYPVCDFCLFYDFNGDKEGAYDGHGVCWHPDHPLRKDPSGECEDFICFNIIKGDDN